jgi:uncharacterized protein (TIGR02145 family)
MLFSKIKKDKKNQKGSALVFSLIILVNAILIVGTVVFISAVQRKTGGKVRYTSSAIQQSDSGMEDVLKKANQSGAESNPISWLCDSFNSSNGKCALNDVDATLYFFDKDNNLLTGTGREVQEIMYAKSVGTAGHNQDRVARAFKVTIGENFICGVDKVEDEDGNEYNTIEAGSKEAGSNCWMADNLNVDKDRLCYDGNCDDDNYGGLYTWLDAMDGSITEGVRGVCPEGWHIPTDDEWHDLEDAFSGATCIDSRTAWDCAPAGSDNNLQDNNYGGFNAKLGGFNDGGGFVDRGSYGYYWTSTATGANDAYYRQLEDGNIGVYRDSFDKDNALSVRCVKDKK